MCYDDCPEETQWVYENAQNVDLIIGIVAGLDLTKHEKLHKSINDFRSNFKRYTSAYIPTYTHYLPTYISTTDLYGKWVFCKQQKTNLKCWVSIS